MAIIVSLSFCCSPAFAADIGTEEETDFIHFTEKETRMESNGDFTFRFHFALTSNTFTANSTSISVKTCAHLVNKSTGVSSTDSSKQFSMVLMRDGFIDTEAGRYYGYADNVYGGLTFNNIKKGDTYYFVLAPTDSNFSNGGYVFEGYGNVSPVTV